MLFRNIVTKGVWKATVAKLATLGLAAESSATSSGKIWYNGLEWGLILNRFKHFYSGPTLTSSAPKAYQFSYVISCLFNVYKIMYIFFFFYNFYTCSSVQVKQAMKYIFKWA